MQVLVTGAAGFVGFHLARRLLDAGHGVVGLDNFSPYYSPALKRARVEQLTSRASFRLEEVDLSDRAPLDEVFRRQPFDLVVHLAAQPGVRYSLENPYSYVDSNLKGFVNLLECLRREKTPRLIYASSSSVYAGQTELPYAEASRTDTPISLYAATKRANELMAHTYSHLFGIQTTGLRFFTAYGPWGRPDMAYWLFTEKILAGAPIPVFNHGRMRRDFTYIDDIIDGVMGVVEHERLGPAEIFNIGRGKPVALLDFIRTLEGALGKEATVKMLPMQPGDVEETFADISRLRDATGYAPKVPITEGAAAFVEWYLDYPALAAAVARDRR